MLIGFIKFVLINNRIMPLKKVAAKKDIQLAEKNPYKEKPTEGFDAKKYNGIMSFKEDALTIQKKLRIEWERDFN
jgi:hypothetical protein